MIGAAFLGAHALTVQPLAVPAARRAPVVPSVIPWLARSVLPCFRVPVKAAFRALVGSRRQVSRLALESLPLRLERLEACGLHRLAAVSEAPLQLGEACQEFVVRAAKGRFGLDPQLPREVGNRKEQVANLFLEPFRRALWGGGLGR